MPANPALHLREALAQEFCSLRDGAGGVEGAAARHDAFKLEADPLLARLASLKAAACGEDESPPPAAAPPPPNALAALAGLEDEAAGWPMWRDEMQALFPENETEALTHAAADVGRAIAQVRATLADEEAADAAAEQENAGNRAADTKALPQALAALRAEAGPTQTQPITQAVVAWCDRAEELINAAGMQAVVADLRSEPRAALCLSGGGIRSGTFALGVMQGLACAGLLGRFHYLSTVSGGGYIGSWLTAWIHHVRTGCAETSRREEQRAATPPPPRRPWWKIRQWFRSQPPPPQQQPLSLECASADRSWETHRAEALRTVLEKLGASGGSDPLHPEPAAIEHLRAYSNYLSPKLGFLSADTWTLVAIWVRNAVLNWLVLVPFLVAILAVPRLCVALCGWKPGSGVTVLPWTKLFDIPPRNPADWIHAFWICGALFLVLAIAYMGNNLPTIGVQRTQARQQPDARFGQGGFLRYCLAPLLLATVLLTLFWLWWPLGTVEHPAWYQTRVVQVGGFGAVVHVLAMVVFLATSREKPRWIDAAAVLISGALGGVLLYALAAKWLPPITARPSPDVYVCFAGPLFLGAFLLALVIYIGFASAQLWDADADDVSGRGPFANDEDREWWARAGAWVLIAGLVWLGLSVISLLGPCLLELGWSKTLTTVGGLSGLITVLFGLSAKSSANTQKTAEGAPSWTTRIFTKAPEIAAPIFAVSLLVLLSIGTTALIGVALPKLDKTAAEKVAAAADASGENVTTTTTVFSSQETTTKRNADSRRATLKIESSDSARSGGSWLPEGPLRHRTIVRLTPAWLDLAVIVGFTLLGLGASWLVNVNIFSMHGMYRDRLIRAYLGASRPRGERKPHPFTGFDEADNLPMHWLWPQPPPLPEEQEQQPQQPQQEAPQEALPKHGSETKAAATDGGDDTAAAADRGSARRLFPVINIALNLVRGEKLAWQERQAESFTVTPLHCGSYGLAGNRGYRRTDPGGPAREVASLLRPGCRYGGSRGITLGTALAISGAAVSPNWGYHSSPVVTFLLTLFNARLGWWLGNPGLAGDETFDRWYPQGVLPPVAGEALGLTDDRSEYVYLSDGGHFDNMGLYEMVLRRCRFIVLCDGEQDDKFTFSGLGMAVRKARIDLGIPIEFDKDQLLFQPTSDTVPKPKAGRAALGRIRYSVMDRSDPDKDGWLLYLKPVCYGDEPRDVFEYWRSHKEFPHETTVDQFFSESQFESYRALGRHTADEVLKKFPGFSDVFCAALGGGEKIVPGAPTGLWLTQTGADSVRASWTPQPRATGYRAYYKIESADVDFSEQQLAAGTEEMTLRGLPPGSRLIFCLRATNEAGESPSSQMRELLLEEEEPTP